MPALSDRISPVQKESLQEAVYRRLSELILEGGIAPGQSITVASLAEAFNVSPMPVREALTRLTSIGALTVVSGRTIGVPKLTLERFDDLRNVRIEVEAAAARWATLRCDDALIRRLTLVRSRLVKFAAESNMEEYIRANYDYHFAIYKYSNSPILLAVIENLWLRISPYLHLLRETGSFQFSSYQHDQMFEGIKERDPEKVSAAVAADIDGAYQVISKLL